MPRFDGDFRAQLWDLIAWRRDVRRFRPEPLPPDALPRLIEIACLAPSVGLSQPWRFVTVDEPGRRRAVMEEFLRCNADALAAYSQPLASSYARLKLAGLQEAPCHLAVFADRETDKGKRLGRRTMPETAEYSVVAAVHTMWLAARAEGIGMGWVSIVAPKRMAEILSVPPDWRFIGYFCIGYPEADHNQPELEREEWEYRRPADEYLFTR